MNDFHGNEESDAAVAGFALGFILGGLAAAFGIWLLS